MDVNSLAHTKWECKYHIVFAPKYRRQIIYKEIKADVGQILGTLCRRKGIEIIEAQCMPDHIHMLVSIPPKYSVSQFMGYLKGKRATSYPSFEEHLEGAQVTHAPAETDANVITGRGMGCSIPFALAVVEYLCGKEEADRIAESVVYTG